METCKKDNDKKYVSYWDDPSSDNRKGKYSEFNVIKPSVTENNENDWDDEGDE